MKVVKHFTRILKTNQHTQNDMSHLPTHCLISTPFFLDRSICVIVENKNVKKKTALKNEKTNKTTFFR